MGVSVHGFGRSTTASTALNEVSDLSAGTRKVLEESGFRSLVFDHRGVIELMIEAGRAAMAPGGVAPNRIDAVLITSESFDAHINAPWPDMYFHLRNAIVGKVLPALGLGHAAHFTNWMSGCGNLAPTLSLALGLVASEQRRQILVIAADEVLNEGNRVMQGGGLPFSDVGAACLVSADQDSGLILRHAVLRPEPALLDARIGGDPLRNIRKLRSGLLALDDQVEAFAGLRLRNFDVVIIENLAEPLIERLCTTLALPRSRLHCPTRASVGHAFSADLLLSLGQMDAECPFEPGTNVAAMSIASWMLSALVFRVA